MEDWQKLLVTKNRPDLLKTTKCNVMLLAELQKAEIISPVDQQEIQAQKTSFEQTDKLYDILITRPGAFDVLLRALQETKQTGATAILDQNATNFKYYGSITYDKTDVIGEGSFNTVVYRGMFGGMEVAVKKVKISYHKSDSEYSLKEVEVLKELDDHENVVRYYFAEQKKKTIYIAMQLCQTNLHDWVHNKCVDMSAEEICRQAGRGVAHIHKNHIIHRDLKATNVLISARKLVKIADFGLSKRIPLESSSVSIKSCMAGTEGWMAPEVLKIAYSGAQIKLTTSSDIFSLGCIFYFVFTNGSHPFGEPIRRQVNINDNAPQFLTENHGLVPPKYLSLVKQMIGPNSKDRPSAENILEVELFAQKKKDVAKFTKSEHDSPKFDSIGVENNEHWKPVNQNDGPYYMERTLLYQHQLNPETFQMNATDEIEKITQHEFVTKILPTFKAQPIVICGKKGIGKSLLLANLAQQVRTLYPDRNVLMLTFQNLAHQYNPTENPIQSNNHTENQVDLSELLESLAVASSTPLMQREALLEMQHSMDKNFDLFLDGFNELLDDEMEKVIAFLKYLIECSNIRIHITTDDEKRSFLEEFFNVLSYTILPLTEDEQMELVWRFWERNPNIITDESTVDRLGHILENLTQYEEISHSEIVSSNSQHQFYSSQSEDENRILQLEDNDNIPKYRFNYLVQIYSKYVESKLNIIKDGEDRALIQKWHWSQALKYLFPDCAEASSFCQLLGEEWSGKPEVENMARDMRLFDPVNKNTENASLSKTLAEYFVSEFIINNCKSKGSVHQDAMSKFIFNTVLATSEYNVGLEIAHLVSPIAQIIENSDLWKSSKRKEHYARLKDALLSNSSLNTSFINDQVSSLISFWMHHYRSKATLDVFVNILTALGWTHIVGKLRRTIIKGELVLHNQVLCFFFNMQLAKYPPSFDENRSQTTYTQLNDSLKLIVLKSASQGYTHLIKYVLSHFSVVPSFEEDFCCKIILHARKIDNLDNLVYCCSIVESHGEVKNSEIRLQELTYKGVEIGQHPLHGILFRGLYRQAKYLISKYYKDSIIRINGLHMACLVNSSNDSTKIIENKVKILMLLKSLSVPFEIKSLEENLPHSVNVNLLTTVCDLVEYWPSTNDINYIMFSVINSFIKDFEMDHFVDWLISKDILGLLTYSVNNSKSLIVSALVMNVLSPETLCKIYRSSRFDLTSLFNYLLFSDRRMALVKAVVTLSGNVNLSDRENTTLLHYASHLRQPDVIRFLLSIGADINCNGLNNTTALHYVFLRTTEPTSYDSIHECVELLLENGANVRSENVNGQTPLLLATQIKSKIESRTIELLVSKLMEIS